LAQPRFFLGELLVEEGGAALFDDEEFFAALHKGVEIDGPAEEAAAVEFGDAGGNAAGKGAVMGDEETAGDVLDQQLGPDDGVDIEMVSRSSRRRSSGWGRGPGENTRRWRRGGVAVGFGVEIEALDQPVDILMQLQLLSSALLQFGEALIVSVAVRFGKAVADVMISARRAAASCTPPQVHEPSRQFRRRFLGT
jgi:hypothetical protein